MLLKAAIIIGLLTGFFSVAQEVRQIDLSDIPQAFDYRTMPLGDYLICGTTAAKDATRAVRVSVESLSPNDIHPKQQLSVTLKIENAGEAPVVLPVSTDIAVLQPGDGAIRYHAVFPINAGLPSGATRLGELQLYGSTLKSDTMLKLMPGEWFTARGNFTAHNWFKSGVIAKAYSDLQFYESLAADNSGQSSEPCVRQMSGATVEVRFSPGQTK